MKYSQEIIEELKFRNNIEDVIGSYVSLQRAGSNYKGLCPFHSEKTPSFTVFPGTKSYYCFGCGSGGDVITFVMKMENLDYVSALQTLARRAGITLPEGESDAEKSAAAQRSRIYDMNVDAARFFRDCLERSPEAQEYLAKRQLSGSAVRHFGLGYAPDGFDLLNHMRSLGYTEDELITGFLCGRSKNSGRAYPYFRRRLMFPIIDLSGHVIAFGGRVLDDSKPKYINTSDTPAFRKSRNLFALNYAVKNGAERMILCEGYMDVVTLHAAGFGYAVATLGTAITEEQARLLKRYTKQVIISYDSDEAGQRAAERAFNLLEGAGLQTRILSMKDAKDPDEYIKKFGADRFRAVIDGGVSRFDFAMNNIAAKNDLNTADGKVEAIRAAARYIADVPSKVEREIYIGQAAKKFDVKADSLAENVEYYIRAGKKQNEGQVRQQVYAKASAIGDRINPDAAKNVRASHAEEALLGLIIVRPEYIKMVRDGKFVLSAEDFRSEFHRKLFELVIENTDETGGFEIGMLAGTLSPDEMSRLVRYSVMRDGLDNGERVFAECIDTLHKSTENKSLEEILNDKRKQLPS